MAHNVIKRYTLCQIRSHQWFTKRFSNSENQSLSSPTFKFKRQCITSSDSIARLSSASQPINCLPNIQTTPTLTDSVKNVCFSQPAGVDNMFLSTQMNSTPFGNFQNVYQRLVKRMTRFFTNTDSKTTLHKMKRLFDKMNYNYKTCDSGGQLRVSTIDKRGMPLVFSASVIDMNSNQILVDFRLTKGDGLEFKRHFVNIRNDLNDMIVKGPITWPLAFATNSLP